MKDLVLQKDYTDYKRKNIALIGHMGSGKSILGKLIAKKLKYEHLDTDKLIEENMKKSINDIFKYQGEDEFRRIEEKIIVEINIKKNLVLSLGGGSILSKKVRIFLFKNFVTLFLDVNLKTLSKRLMKSKKRPLLINSNVENKIKELDTIRREYYLLADIILKNCSSTENAIINFFDKYEKLDEKNY